MPAATDFLLNFNDDEFNIQVRAREYYSFFVAHPDRGRAWCSRSRWGSSRVTRLGIVTPQQLPQNRRYAMLVICGRRDAAARHRPGHDADRDGAPAGAVRALALLARLSGTPAEPAALRAGARAARQPGELGCRTCSSTSAASASGSSRSSTRAGGALPGRLRRLRDRQRRRLGGASSTRSGRRQSAAAARSARQYDDQIENANEQLAKDPNDTAALLKLVQVEFYKAQARESAQDPDHGSDRASARTPTPSSGVGRCLGAVPEGQQGPAEPGDRRSDRAGVLLPRTTLGGAAEAQGIVAEDQPELGLLRAARRLPVRLAGHRGRRRGGEQGRAGGAEVRARERPSSSSSRSGRQAGRPRSSRRRRRRTPRRRPLRAPTRSRARSAASPAPRP